MCGGHPREREIGKTGVYRADINLPDIITLRHHDNDTKSQWNVSIYILKKGGF